MRPIQEPIRIEILRLWLNGESYRRISEQTGVAIGTISEIIAEYRKRIPDIDELRQLRSTLGQASVPDALRGALFLAKLDEWQFDSQYLPSCLNLIKQAGERAPELISAGSRLIDLEQKAGKPYEQFLHKFKQELAAETELQARLKTLEEKEVKLQTSIRHLEKLTRLQQTIERNNITADNLESLIQHMLGLQKLGFTTLEAEILAKELAKRNLDPATASLQIATLLQKFSSLEDAIEKAEAEAKKWESERDTAQHDAELLRKECRAMRDEIQRLEEAHRVRKELLEKEYEALKAKHQADHDATIQMLEVEFQKRMDEGKAQVQGLKDQANELTADLDKLKLDKDAAAQQLSSIKANISEAEAALQRIKEAAKGSKLLATIVSLIENPAAQESCPEVLEAMLTISQAFKTCVEQYRNGWKNRRDILSALDPLQQSVMNALERR